MEYIFSLLAIPAWRFRGGWLHDKLGITGNAPGRSVWSIVSATIVMYTFDASYGVGTLCLIGAYIGASLGHRSYIAFGRPVDPPIDRETHENWALLPLFFSSPVAQAMTGLLQLGIMRGALAAAPFPFIGMWHEFIAVILIYIIGHVGGYGLAAATDWYPDIDQDWIARAEWIVGGAFAIAFASTALLY